MIKQGNTTTITKKESSGAWMRNAAIGIGVGGALFIGISSIFKGQGKKEYDKDIKKSEEELSRLPVKVWYLTKDAAVYRMLADTIHVHLDDENHGGIFNSFKYAEIKNSLVGLNPEELRQVAKEFGYRNARVIFFIRSSDKANLFTWFEGVLDKTQQAEMRKIWQKSGLWGNQLTTAQKNAFLKTLWTKWYFADVNNKVAVFPGATSLQNGIFINGKWTPLPNILASGYWQLGNAISWIKDANGNLSWVKVKITNIMYPDLLQKERWIPVSQLNKKAPTQEDPYNFPITPISKV